MSSDEHLYSIALRRCNLVGDINFRKLVAAAGSAREVWESSQKILTAADGIGRKIAADIGNPQHLKFAENELAFCEKNGIRINLKHLGDLPPQLSECEDAPAILYQKGEFPAKKTLVSIVGTRNFTSYGKDFLKDFFEKVPAQECATVSGLALGTDTEVHEKSLEKHIPTIGVLAHGFHTFYPAKNRKLSENILENGGSVITEFNTSQKPDRENFIQRNRIIAGLSAGTIVVETAFGGGSVSTATFASNYNRDVFALPGRITDKYSQGCNHLIFKNKAAAISTVELLLKELGFNDKKQRQGALFPPAEMRKTIAGEHKAVYDFILKSRQIGLDELSLSLEIPTYKISGILLDLEFDGYVRPLSGKQFCAIP